MSRQLSDYELEELLKAQTPENVARMRRLLEELREMRDQAGERERMYDQEVEW